MNAEHPPAHPFLPGFDPVWRDVPDFVLGMTERIWERRHVAALRRHYAPDAAVRSPAGVLTGHDAILGATLATLAAFPDLEPLGEDVIWAATGPADADGRAGFVASHRTIGLATHAGAGLFGPPTGRGVAFRGISECWCAEDRICDEWRVDDRGAILRQIGTEPKTWAADLIDSEGGPDACLRPLSPDTDPEGAYAGRGTRNAVSDRLETALKRIMDGDLSPIAVGWDRACELAYPGGRTEIGRAAAERFWIGLRGAMSSAAFRVEHRIGIDAPGQAPRAALRWSLYGRHDGPGPFGPPTGAYLYVMGITHAEFGPRGLRREWTLYDETAIWKQILLATG